MRYTQIWQLKTFLTIPPITFIFCSPTAVPFRIPRQTFPRDWQKQNHCCRKSENVILLLALQKNKKGKQMLTDMIRYDSGGTSNWLLDLPPFVKLRAKGLKYFLTSRTFLNGLRPLQQSGSVWSSNASSKGLPESSLFTYGSTCCTYNDMTEWTILKFYMTVASRLTRVAKVS